ncbi:unnamed protein product [Vitrella brassicaformis CCMP3155]|uniref:Uncharacterized protein n=1 Tax=Vitrella brassicaformis (strain CCMP3155) TaxID=1169540 RepID=A0A0G4F2H4_VITBC|nr:unnamed protein product [Vitrella brassicaformis CCMP3155]|eukprot:CEM05744.1 unnamed protein product [Vitrella brassicaformis CCMP3155]
MLNFILLATAATATQAFVPPASLLSPVRPHAASSLQMASASGIEKMKPEEQSALLWRAVKSSVGILRRPSKSSVTFEPESETINYQGEVATATYEEELRQELMIRYLKKMLRLKRIESLEKALSSGDFSSTAIGMGVEEDKIMKPPEDGETVDWSQLPVDDPDFDPSTYLTPSERRELTLRSTTKGRMDDFVKSWYEGFDRPTEKPDPISG